MSTSYGASAEICRCISAVSSPFRKLYSYRSKLCVNSSWSIQRFLTLSMTSKRLDGRNGENGISCSISNSSHVKITKDRTEGLTYKHAGVDIDAGSELVKRIAKVAPGIGGFGGLFPLGDSYLVAGKDGVGTKLKLAYETGIHETIGIDLVIYFLKLSVSC